MPPEPPGQPGRPGPSADDRGPRRQAGLAGQLREKIAELAAQVRREPGCLTFTAYEARDVPGRFYLYEVYASAAAFAEHLQTQPVHDFIASVPAFSTAQPGSLMQLDEITVG